MLFILLAVFASSISRAETIVPLGSTWKYFKGTAEASNPTTAWRDPNFDDSAWPSGPAAFYYGETLTGTPLNDMRNLYTTVFLRKNFTIANPADYERLVLRTLIDDSFIVWINGKEVTPRMANAPLGEPVRTNTATGASIEMTWVTNTCAGADYLVAGNNVIAVQVFNQALNSSDIVFNMQVDSSTDHVAPTIVSINPAAGEVQQLTSITVTFSEPVQGVTSDDLLINNSAATSVSGAGNVYTFTFDQPAFGPVDVSWEAGHGITDLADPPNDFDATGQDFTYMLKDSTPPTVLTVNPPNGSTVKALTQIDVRFSEEVADVDAADLLVNGVPATDVIANGNLYSFKFAPVAPGAVNVTWAAAHGITDLANPANPFAGATYSYTVDPNFNPAVVVISEFLAAEQNALGLKDEDGELQDWIELYNASAAPVNLEGWSLTDDPEDPDLWLFPNVTLGAGARMVVFASMKDRRPTTGNLHTNFKLNAAGEYLGLYNAESPRRVMTEINFPEQRNDYSYGLDAQNTWQYFQTPTPGAANGTTTIVGLIPKLKPSIKRGTFDAPFTLVITNEVPGITIRYTTDGSEPTASNGQIFGDSMVISTTTIFRAAGFKANYLPSETLTESYIFLDQVLVQPNNPPGFPVGPTVWSGYPSDYEMDPEIVHAPEYKDKMKSALQALPIISIAIRPYDMWDSVNGIYTHPTSRGPAWERPCSIEFMAQDGKDFQEDAGIQIQGNAAREPIKNPKHPMRVVFKGDYGASKLNFKMFPDSPVETFDTLVLRADFNNQWLHWNPTQRTRGQRIRDSWMKDSMRAMGDLASHNRYCHLYINGIYWGIYDPSERPDAAFGAAYLGGKKADYDVVNEGAAVDGTMTAYNTMLGIANLTDINQYNLMKTYLDMPQFIDYMLLHFYVGHEDWGLNKNWYTIRPKDGSSGFKYVPWDGEMILGDTTINRVSNTDVPSGLHTKLLASAQYKMDFADRVQKHMFNDGALTPAQNAARWAARSREIVSPIIAESARWGDYRRDVHQYQSPPYELYTRNVQWAAEQARLTNTYFPGRTATVLSQLKTAGLFPSVNAPVFNKNGGKINPGFQLTMTGTATIYYTTNGVDPRVYGTGAIAADAQPYAGAIALNGNVQVKARVWNGTIWSALSEATFSDQSPRIPLRFTEIMYNPEPPGDAYEYLELQNFSPLPLDVSGWFITGVDYIFPPNTILQPGQIILLGSLQNVTSFKTRYPGVTAFGYFGGQLLNRGEHIAVVRPDGRVVTAVPFDDEAGWPAEADGRGYSLEVIDPMAEPSDPANWRASAQVNGTPGRANPERPAPAVVFNEVYATSPDTTDFLELRSQVTTNVDLSGWSIWKIGNSTRFYFPAGTTLDAGAYIVVKCDRLTNSPGFHAPYALDSQGDTYVLSTKTGVRVDARTVGEQVFGKSSGLLNGTWQLLAERTPGADNSTAAELGSPSSLVINEWFANPPTGQDDWFEIYNTDPTRAIDLRGLFMGVTNQMCEILTPIFVGPGAFVRPYANEVSGGLDFRLPAEGETIKIYDALGNVLHQVTYGAQAEGISEGRYPDATSSIVSFAYATPGAPNTLNFPVQFAAMANNSLQLEWPAIAGMKFQIQGAADLTPPVSWQGVQDVTAANTVPVVELQVGADNRFFRVVRLP
ncbi:MAG TPA: lamin tail domain-containing protein [Verrucomicrobiae bacterium]